MSVISWSFLAFFAVLSGVYYLPPVRRRAQAQNILLLLGSFVFYGIADLKALPLLAASVIVFYFLGLAVERAIKKEEWRRAALLRAAGVCLGTGTLLGFKYLGAFLPANGSGTLRILLPLGLSFYTFRLIGYLIDVYREKIPAEKDPIRFALFVSFFPTLVSGPIDRAGKFLPQLREGRLFDYGLAMDGFFQVLWGLFEKMCIADNLAPFTGMVWAQPEQSGSLTLAFTALLYPIQIYADFDGYSHITIGLSKFLGIKVARNFDHPFFSRNIAEYWRKWHMSLTSWLTDYVFTPLSVSFRNLGKVGICLAVVITFTLIGMWHGADWTFALFGLYHGLLYIPLVFSGSFQKRRKLKAGKWGLPAIGDMAGMMLTYLLVALGLVLFRAPGVSEAVSYACRMLAVGAWKPYDLVVALWNARIPLFFPLPILVLFLLEWARRDKEHPLQHCENAGSGKSMALDSCITVSMLMAIILLQGHTGSFIYFNF